MKQVSPPASSASPALSSQKEGITILYSPFLIAESLVNEGLHFLKQVSYFWAAPKPRKKCFYQPPFSKSLILC
jgi:hypothetical protein